MLNVAVLPVPDCALQESKLEMKGQSGLVWVDVRGFGRTYWAMTSRPETMGLMARCWIADGRSNPEGKKKMKKKKKKKKKKRKKERKKESKGCVSHWRSSPSIAFSSPSP